MRIENSLGGGVKVEGGPVMKACFILFGISTLIGWNSVLSNIDLFTTFQSDLNPGVTLSLLNYALNIPVQIFLFVKKKAFSLKTQLIISLIGTITCLISIPFAVLFFEKNSTIGIILSVVIFLLYGVINALLSSGFFGLASFFPTDMIISLSTGQGISGIISALLEVSLLFIVQTKDKESKLKTCAFIYFGIATFLLIICLIALLFGFSSSYFKSYLAPLIEAEKKKSDMESQVSAGLFDEENREIEKDIIEQERQELTFKQIFQKLICVNILTFCTLLVTFILFPYVCINQNLFNLDEYNSIAIILLFNCFGTLGRYAMKFFKPTQKLGTAVIAGRSILILSLFFNNFCSMRLGVDTTITSIYLIANVVILAFTQGFGASLCIALAPTYFSDEYKGKAGFSVSLFQIMGILVGSLLSFFSKKIMQEIGIFEKGGH